MVKLLKAQLNILIHQKGFRFSLFFLITAVAGNFIFNVVRFWNIEQADMYSFLEISLLSQTNRLGWYITVFFPFLLVLPGGLSLAVDKKTKTDLLWISRCGKGRYLLSKMLAALSIIPLAVSCYASQYYCHLFIPVYFILSMIGQVEVTVGKVRFDYNYYGFIQWCTGSIDGKDTVMFSGMIAVLFLSAGAVLLHEARKDTV